MIPKMQKQIQENGMPPLTSMAYTAAPSTSRETEVQDALAAAAHGSTLNAPASCPMCKPLNRTLQVAFSQLRSAEMQLEAQTLLGKEAGEQSAARVGGYDALEMLYARHGVPFKHKSGIPPAFQKKISPAMKATMGLGGAYTTRLCGKPQEPGA